MEVNETSPPWHVLSAEQALAALNSSGDGLSEEEAIRRLKDYGLNEIRGQKAIHPLKIFLDQFASLIVGVLIAAGAISGLLGQWADSVAIVSIVFLNAVIGFFQEFKAERSMAALKKMTAPRARVRRSGRSREIPALQLVPGDVLELEAGDLIPADARLLDVSSLLCVEAALTGESEPVTKHPVILDREDVPLGDRINMVFMGASVCLGRGLGVAVATGMRTEFGKIAGLLQRAAEEEKTPLQMRLQSVGRFLVWGCLGAVSLIFFLGLARGIAFFELFFTSVSLAVAAVPEGLPAVVTIALALGVQRMARRRGLIRRLPAVETLGSTDVICTDKTGTLTVGEMTVREIFVDQTPFTVTGEGYAPAGSIVPAGTVAGAAHQASVEILLRVFVGCTNASLVQEQGVWKVTGDPTEGALLAAGEKIQVARSALESAFPRVREYPFDSDRKLMTIVRRAPGGILQAFVKGAPDVVLGRCTHLFTGEGVRPIREEDFRRITERIRHMGRRSLRVLAAAYREGLPDSFQSWSSERIEKEMIFAGLAGMQDPPRSEAGEAVSRCQNAGIRVVMITGDHPQTAFAVAREVGISASEDSVVTGTQLDRLSEAELHQRIGQISVYARVSAEHKLRVVKAWQAAGAVIAMTGDGVNDAPAIKGADIGIAMGRSGAEVTREASDMVITDDNFASIVAAVEEGRGIYDNIKKSLQYLLAGNVGELLLMSAAVIGGWPLPLLPIHLLWINLVTDGLPALCLAADPIHPGVMKRPPRPRGERMTDASFFFWMLLTGSLTAGVALGVFFQGLGGGDLQSAQTRAFAVLVYAELFRSFGARSETKPVWEIGLFSNIRLAIAVGITLLAQPWTYPYGTLANLFRVSPMGWEEYGALMALGLGPLGALELVKVVFQRIRPAKTGK